MRKSIRFIVSMLLAVCVASLVSANGVADDEATSEIYPTKPIRTVVPFGAGGGSDTLARGFQQLFDSQDLLDQPLVIVNVPGAGGSVGSRRVKDADADGYEILFNHVALLAGQAGNRVDFGYADFEPVAATGLQAQVIFVGEDAPWDTLDEFLSYAKSNPEAINFGVNMGGINHVAGLLLADAADVKFNFVQIGGGADNFAAIKGGHVDCSVFSGSEIVNNKQQGLKPLATYKGDRDPYNPEIPTMKEQGVDLAFVAYQMWFAPKGTPADVIVTLADAFEAAITSAEGKEMIEGRFGMAPGFIRGEALADYLAETYGNIEDIMPDLN